MDRGFAKLAARGGEVRAQQLRKWSSTAMLAATAQVGESRLFLLDYGLRLLRVVVLLSIWRVIVASRPGASPLPLDVLLTYTLIAEAFGHVMVVRTGLAESIWQGTLVHYFLRPVGVVRQFAAEASGLWLVDLALFTLPLLMVAPLLGVDPAPASPLAALLFAISLLLGISIGLALEFLFGALTLVADQPVWLVENARRALVGLLSGVVIPLSVLPFGLGDLFAWLPFAATAWAPLAIYTGVSAALPMLALQAGWSLLLWPLALLLWHANREKVVAHGG